MFNKEHELLLPQVKQPWRKMTLRQIKNECAKTSEGYVYNTLQKHVKNNILSSKKVGNQVLYSLNIDSKKCLSYISAISEHYAWTRTNIPYNVLEDLMKRIVNPAYSFIITGSYANNTQKKSSDIDIVILVESKRASKAIESELHYSSELSIPKAHLHVFTYDEFYFMLVNLSANYGKEISSNNLILNGASIYYSIMFKAIRNGYNSHKLFG